MPTFQDTVTDQLVADCIHASVELGQARQLMRLKDSHANRAAVTEWARAIDVLLDMLLQVRCPAPGSVDWAAARETVPSVAAA